MQYLPQRGVYRYVVESYKQLVAVHEYGGGSFIVVDGSVLFVTTTGIYKQQSADSAPEVIFEGGSSRRFADLFYSGVCSSSCSLLCGDHFCAVSFCVNKHLECFLILLFYCLLFSSLPKRVSFKIPL